MSEFLGFINPATDKVTIAENIVTGFADDDMITISRNEDVSTTYVGTKGDITVVTNPNKVGTLTLRLQETSPFNAFLFAALGALEAGQAGGKFSVSAEREGSSILKRTEGWVQTQPDVSYGKEANVYEWVITIRTSILDLGIIGDPSAAIVPPVSVA